MMNSSGTDRMLLKKIYSVKFSLKVLPMSCISSAVTEESLLSLSSSRSTFGSVGKLVKHFNYALLMDKNCVSTNYSKNVLSSAEISPIVMSSRIKFTNS